MIINHNMNAMNAQRNMGINTKQAGKSMEKLSSGLRINRAGDDAAGLAISEKMRAQIRGLDQASRNSEDAISMIQTAEGALNETHSILQRMRELAVQAGNDTNTTADRGEIQKEINQLTSEINRVGNTTEFNNQKLLNGSSVPTASGATLEGGVDAVSAAVAAKATGEIDDGANGFKFEAKKAGAAGNGVTVEVKIGTGTATEAVFVDNKLVITTKTGGDSWDVIKTAIEATTFDDTYTITGKGTTTTDVSTAIGEKTISGGKDEVTKVDAVAASGTLKFADELPKSGMKITVNSKVYELYDTSKGDTAPTAGTGIDIKGLDTTAKVMDALKTAINKDTNVSVTVKGNEMKIEAKTAGKAGNEFTLKAEGPEGTTGKSYVMQVGANENQTMTVDFNDMRSAALGLTGTGKSFSAAANVTNGTNNTVVENSLDVGDSNNAGKAVTVIQKAIDTVSAERSKLGAFQNRLEHTINNLGTSSENLTAAESRIRDVDMAKEMMTFSKNNILQQAAQAMLAQANQQPQNVLQLLR